MTSRRGGSSTNVKKGRRGRRGAKRTPIWLILGGLLLGAAAIGLALGAARTSAARAIPEVIGAPRLKASPERVDVGNVRLGQQVRVDIRLTNTGDQPLRISEPPWVEVVEGC